jgi:imidazolonepropionase-like amidohydrolase
MDAVRAGVISLHSGEFADQEGLELMKEKSCVLVPTIAWLHYRINEAYAREYTRTHKLSDDQLRRFIDDCSQAYETCRETIRMAYRIGTPVGIGSDAAHVFPPYDVAFEMSYFQDEGVPPLQIITAATKTSAYAIGRGEVWGTLEPGKAADVLVVDGDPSKDIRILLDKARIEMIVQDGRIAKDSLPRRTASASA